MEITWQKTYAQLKEYVAKNPSISIGINFITIPGDVRPEFYRLFDEIRTAFIKDYFADFLGKGWALSKAWADVGKTITGQMSIEAIEVTPSINLFLLAPLEGLMRSLLDPLFELLKGTIAIDVFETEGKRLMSNAFNSYFKEGYRRWVELAFVSLLNPDKSYRVPVVDQIAEPLMGEGHENPGQHVGSVSEAEEYNKISFQQHPVVSFVVPRVLIRSARLGRYVALHSEFVEPYWTARQVSGQTEWYDFTTLKRDNGLAKIRPDQKILPDLTRILPDIAVYTAEDLEDITLVADHRRIMRPDISIEVMEENDWYDKGKMASVRRHQDVMKPKFGTYIICREAPPQAAIDELKPKLAAVPQPVNSTIKQNAETAPSEAQEPSQPQPAAEPPPDIHLVTVGYDMKQLGILLEGLSRAQQSAV